MNPPTVPRQLQLEKKAIHSLADATGLVLACDEGAVWLTVDGDSRDFVLEPGQTFQAEERGRVLMYALAPSRVTISAAAPAAAVSPRRRLASNLWDRALGTEPAGRSPRHA
jgi:hypothetical protein